MKQMPTDSTIIVEVDDISLLDLLIVVAENLKLLILGPVVVGLLALGVGYALPQSFTSQAILALPTPTPTPTQAAAMMVSAVVLDPVIVSLNLFKGRTVTVARTELASQVKATVDKADLLRLDVTANTPIEAQKIASAIIDSWIKSTEPRGQTRMDLETRLAYVKASLDSVQNLAYRLNTPGGKNLSKSTTQIEIGASIIAARGLEDRYFAEILDIQRLLLGVAPEVVRQQPTLPTEPVAPKKSRAAVLAALGSGFFFLLWVFVRQAWKNTGQDSQIAEKQARLLTALGRSASDSRRV